MTNFAFDDFVRTTFTPATYIPTGDPLTPQQMDLIIDYLKSPGSGPDSTSSFAQYVSDKMLAYPPELPPDMDYVGFSGKDITGTPNFKNSTKYVTDVERAAGIIGDTPWGDFISKKASDPSFNTIEQKFTTFLSQAKIRPLGNEAAGALEDMMWNAGSPRYFENAIATGKPLVAFVENAPANRGFSNFELTTALEHPNARINGYPVSAFGPDPLAFVSQSAAEYQSLERTLARHASAHGTDPVKVSNIRLELMPIEGYDALAKTLYARPLEDIKKLSLAEMIAVRVEWTAARGTLPDGPRLTAEVPEPPHRAPGQPGAPRGPPHAVAVSEAAEAVAEAVPHRIPGGLNPGMKAAGIAGLALMAHDFGTTGHKWVQLHSQGNDAAADSTAAHFVGRNVGGAVGGFIAGAGVGLTTGSWTGPGAIITGIGGGAFGAYLGEKWAEQKDIDRVYTQVDTLGRTWQRDPADPDGRWLRGSHQQQVQSADLGNGVEVRPVQTAQGDNVTFRATYVATGTLERQLNHQAAKASYELGLDHLPPPRDPYRINASAETYPPRAPFETGRDYVRDASSGEWMLEIQRLVDGRAPINHREPVDPERLPMLDEQSRTIIAQNAANTPAALAARYMVAHEQQRWDDFATRDSSAVPSAIQNARDNPDTLKASNGQTYTRQADGQWLHDGVLFNSTANLNLRDELELTWRSQEAGVQGLSQMADQIWESRQLEPEGVRGQLEDLYAKHGVARTPEQLDATAAAVQLQLAQSGKPEFVTLELMPDPRTHAPSADSPVAAFSDDGGNRMVLRSTTTVEDVAQHQAQLATSPAPVQGAAPAMLDAVTVTASRPEAPVQAPTLLPSHPDHPDHPAYDKIHKWVEKTGNWNEEQSHNVAASLYRKQAENPAFQRVDRVTGALGPNGEHNVIATYAPHGDKPPFFNAVVDGREAMHQPAQQNLEQAEVVKQEQARQQGREQAPPAMHM